MYFHNKARQALYQDLSMSCNATVCIDPPVCSTQDFSTGSCDGTSERRTAALKNFVSQDNSLLSGEDGVKV